MPRAASRKLVYGEDGRHVYGGCVSPDGKYVLFTGNMKEDGDPGNAGAPMGLMRLADAPIIAGESKDLRALHPDAKSGPVLRAAGRLGAVLDVCAEWRGRPPCVSRASCPRRGRCPRTKQWRIGFGGAGQGLDRLQCRERRWRLGPVPDAAGRLRPQATDRHPAVQRGRREVLARWQEAAVLSHAGRREGRQQHATGSSS